MNSDISKYMIIAGILLIAAGIVYYFFSDKFSWLGHLPGDIKVEKENFRFYFPLTTLIIVSLFLNILLWLIRRFL